MYQATVLNSLGKIFYNSNTGLNCSRFRNEMERYYRDILKNCRRDELTRLATIFHISHNLKSVIKFVTTCKLLLRNGYYVLRYGSTNTRRSVNRIGLQSNFMCSGLSTRRSRALLSLNRNGEFLMMTIVLWICLIKELCRVFSP